MKEPPITNKYCLKSMTEKHKTKKYRNELMCVLKKKTLKSSEIVKTVAKTTVFMFWWRQLGSNQRPHACQACTLTN